VDTATNSMFAIDYCILLRQHQDRDHSLIQKTYL
jgi:hypothetical protein